MCANTDYGLTIDGLLNDPLIQMVMRSDGVTQQAHADLWERAREATVAEWALRQSWCPAEAAR